MPFLSITLKVVYMQGGFDMRVFKLQDQFYFRRAKVNGGLVARGGVFLVLFST